MAVLAGEPWVLFRWPMVGTEDGIWLSRPDGSDRHELLPTQPGGRASPAWAPDGQRIVFEQRDPEESIWVVNVDGSDAHQIVPAIEGCCGQDHLDWSPDGSAVAFMRWLGPESALTSQVMVYRFAGESLEVAATVAAPLVLDHPRWSPDGATFAVEVAQLTDDATAVVGGAIGLIPIATGELETITRFEEFGGYPSWSPDGEQLAFDVFGLSYFRETPEGEATNLMSVSRDGSGLRQLTDFPADGRRATQPYWTSHGTIVYVDTTAEASDELFVQFLSDDGAPLPPPDTTIRGSYPRLRPVPTADQ